MNLAFDEQRRPTYTQVTDGELLDLACAPEALTDSARNALASELRLRGLGEKDIAEHRRQTYGSESGWDWGRVVNPKRWKRKTPDLLLFYALAIEPLVYLGVAYAFPRWFGLHRREVRMVYGLSILAMMVFYAVIELVAIQRRERRRKGLLRVLATSSRLQRATCQEPGMSPGADNKA